MAAKWRHTIWMFLCIHKTLSVIHVIGGFRGHVIHFYWYYVHLTSLEPIFWSSEQDAQNKPRSPPPPPKKKFTFIEQNDFVMQQNQQDPRILDHSYAFCSHSVCKRSYKRPKCALIAYRSRNISHGLLLHPVLGHSDAFNLKKIIFQFHEYCARGLSKFKSCMEVLRSALINTVALRGS